MKGASELVGFAGIFILVGPQSCEIIQPSHEIGRSDICI